MTNYLSQNINNIYNSDIDNKIKQLELNQIKKKKNNSEFLNQFDELKFNEINNPIGINEINNAEKGKNFFLQRDLDFQLGYSEFELNNTNYDVINNSEFTHNNMTPNTNKRDTYTNYSIPHRTLETFTGVFNNYVSKTEKVPLFDPVKDLTWINGMPSISNVLKSRYLRSNKNNGGDLPFTANLRVKPGSDNKNLDSNNYVHRINPQTIDTLRSKINQKVSYETPIIQSGKKGENRSADSTLTKFKLPDFREQTFDKLIPNKAENNKGQICGNFTNMDTLRNMKEDYNPGAPVNINKGSGPNTNTTKFEPSKRESYLNDSTHGINSVENRPVMTNIKSFSNYENQRASTNSTYTAPLANGASTYHVDYNNIPLVTMRELMIYNDNTIGVSSNQAQNYVFSNDMVLPIKQRQVLDNQEILGPNTLINQPQLYNNDIAKDTMKHNTMHDIVTNTISLINQPQLYNNDILRDTMKQNTMHDIVTNTQSLINQPQLYNNDILRDTMKQCTSHNIVTNIQSLINHNQLYNNDTLRNTMKQNTMHDIVTNTIAQVNQNQLYNNDILRNTIKQNTMHNIVTNTKSLVNQNQLYNNDITKDTMKQTTIFENMGNINNNLSSYTIDINDNAKPTIKQNTIYNNYISNITSDIHQKTYTKNYDDIAKDTIKQTTIDNNYLSNINNTQQQNYTRDEKDILQVTIKETTIDNKYNGNINYKNCDIYVKDKNDIMKPTLKQTTIYQQEGNINNGSLSYLKNNDELKKTIKETTIDNNYEGNIMSNNINYLKNNDTAKVTHKQTTILKDYTGTLKYNNADKPSSHLATDNMTSRDKKEQSIDNRAANGRKDLNGPYIDKCNVKLINPILYSYSAPPRMQLDNNASPSISISSMINNKKPIIENDNTIYLINDNFINTLKNNPYVNDIMHQKNLDFN